MLHTYMVNNGEVLSLDSESPVGKASLRFFNLLKPVERGVVSDYCEVSSIDVMEELLNSI